MKFYFYSDFKLLNLNKVVFIVLKLRTIELYFNFLVTFIKHIFIL